MSSSQQLTGMVNALRTELADTKRKLDEAIAVENALDQSIELAEAIRTEEIARWLESLTEFRLARWVREGAWRQS